MQLRRKGKPVRWYVGLGVASAIVAASLIADATYTTDTQISLTRSFSYQGTAVVSNETLVNQGVYDGTNWVRQSAASGGVQLVATCATTTIGQVSVSSVTSTAVPTTAQTNKNQTCIFNQDTAIIVYCRDGTATTANSSMIEPRTGRCFGSTEAMQCLAASGTPVVDVVECGP